MGDSNTQFGGELGDSSALELTGKVMVVAIISIFFAVAFVILIYIYTKWLGRRGPGSLSTRRRRFGFSAGYQEETNAAAAAVHRGLDPAVLKTIPVVKFSPEEFKDGLECAVCLNQVCEGEKARLLPNCNHGFHVDCIDMWFHSHSTCPLCRNPVSKSAEESSVSSVERPDFPANVLFWGDETRVSTLGPCLPEPREGPISVQLPPSSSSPSSSSKGLVIDIPREIGEEDEEQKSPMSTRMRSLKRLLSRGKRVTPGSPSSNLDVEQGGRSQS